MKSQQNIGQNRCWETWTASTLIELYEFSILVGSARAATQRGFDSKARLGPLRILPRLKVFRQKLLSGHRLILLAGARNLFRRSIPSREQCGLFTSPSKHIATLTACWETWNRTKIHGFKGRCPTFRRSPNVFICPLNLLQKGPKNNMRSKLM